MYILGKDNGRADALSWRHDIASKKEIISTAILRVNEDRLIRLAKELNLLITIRHPILEEL